MTLNKKIGQYDIEIETSTGKIAIVGDYNSNFGRYYTENFRRFTKHPKGEEHEWNRPQILGMDWEYGITPAVKKYLYSLIGKIETN